MSEPDESLANPETEFQPEEPACTYSIGIDPGWKNLGLAVVKRKEDGSIEIVKTLTVNPSEYGIVGAAEYIVEQTALAVKYKHIPKYVVIERYVSYNNVLTTEAENIVSLIGAFQFAFKGVSTHLFRAIDWKVNLVKALVRKFEFSNPSSKLDKKFSIAAAQACLQEEHKFPNDHEADAVCLASYPFITELM